MRAPRPANTLTSRTAYAQTPGRLLNADGEACIRHALETISGPESEKAAARRWISQVLDDVARLDLVLYLADQTLAGRVESGTWLASFFDSLGPDDSGRESQPERRAIAPENPDLDIAQSDKEPALNQAALLKIVIALAWTTRDREHLQRCLYGLGALSNVLLEVDRLLHLSQAVLHGVITNHARVASLDIAAL